MLSKFFLERPVFAWVTAIAMMVLGGLAIYQLPIAQYPPMAPPSIRIRAAYPGASAETVESTVTQVIEQKMTGLDKMLYMSSTSDSAGMAEITLTFAPGTDPDIAWVKVQNKLNLAMASLPEAVQKIGVDVQKSTKNYLMAVALVSENGSMNEKDLRDYAQSKLQDTLARVPGVGEIEALGWQYAMRIWLNPDKLTDYNLTIDDVVAALRAYNVEVSAGQFGGTPSVKGQRLNASIIVQSLLKTPDEFAVIPLRVNPDGSIVKIKDVGRVELGSEYEDISIQYNGKPSGMLLVRAEPGANALATADRIKSKLLEMSRDFPAGLKVVYPYDTTPFIRVAIHEAVKALFEAIVLVFLVMWLFLGNFRATLVPTIAVPVVILGTFAVLGLLGFSINMLTMFAMVLAIGLLVDDAIVVIENVERLMHEEGLSPMDAAAKSMEQITPALVGIGLVLAAVFGPMAFFSGSTGVLYRQFSVTIAAAMLLSVVVALILSPVLCATFLKPVAKGHDSSEGGIKFLRPFFRWFNHVFDIIRDRCVAVVGHALARKLRFVAAFLAIVVGLGFIFMRMPTSYLPDEDQGILFGLVMMPTGSTLEQTQEVLNEMQAYFMENEKDAIESVSPIAGYSFSGRTQNNGMMFIKLKDWKLRNRADLRVNAIAARAMQAASKIRAGMVFYFPPPPVIELGTAKGFDFQLQDRGGLGHTALMDARNQLLGMAAQDKRLIRVRPNGLEDVPQYRTDVDWEKAGTLGLPINAVHDTLSAGFGSAYVNNFVQGGRVKKVFIQADASYRMLPGDLKRLYVRNTSGKMVPFDSFASTRWSYGSPRLERYNTFAATEIWGEPAPGVSSGEAMKAMEELAGKLPQGINFEWTALSYQERQAGSQKLPLYIFSLVVIFLCLAALYESWPIPVAILLVLPLGAIGGALASSWRGLSNDVYFQIGLLTTLGLTTKNAILIIQFAKALVEEGKGIIEATLEAVKLRFRPIMMTSLAFGIGVLPLALATGAGAGAMNAIGTSVLGGMVTGTLLVIVFAPLFYVLIEKIFGKKQPQPAPAPTDFGAHLKAISQMGTTLFLFLGLTVLVAGCTMAPKYNRPAAPVPSAWPGDATCRKVDSTNVSPVPDLNWREFFTDQKLQSLIEQALANNRDLRVATLNVEKTRALYGIQRSELFPTIYGTTTGGRQRVAKDFSPTGKPETFDSYSANLGVASWELDFFGRIRSLKEEALHQYLASEQGRRSAQIVLVSSVAQAYLALVADRESLGIAQTTLQTQQAAYDLIKRRHDLGLLPEFDVFRAQVPVDTARRDVATFTQQVAKDENALNLLVGSPTGAELSTTPAALSSISPPKEIGAGLSSEVLLRRPDVLAAEDLLKAANADIGAARANFFPRISLTAVIGSASGDLSDLFKKGAGTWSYAPQIVMPIFDPRTWYTHRASKVQREIAVAQYDKAIQSAFREVADTLAVRGTVDEQVAAQQSLVNATAETYRLANSRYDKGLDSFLSVLDAQRSLFSAQQGLVLMRLSKLENQVRLYAVLGGGWEAEPSVKLAAASGSSPQSHRN